MNDKERSARVEPGFEIPKPPKVQGPAFTQSVGGFAKKSADIFDRAATALGDSFPSGVEGNTPSSFRGSAVFPAPQTSPSKPAAGTGPSIPQGREFGITPPGRGSAQKYGYGQHGTGTLTRADGTIIDVAKHIFENYQNEDGSFKRNTTSADGKTWAITTSASPDYSALFAKQNDDLFAASMAAFRRGDHPSQLRGNTFDPGIASQGAGVSPDLWKQRQDILDRINFQSMGSAGSSINGIIKREFGLKPLRNQLNSVDELIRAQMGLQATAGKQTRAEEDPAVKDARQHANAKELKMMELEGQAGIEGIKQRGAAANRPPDRDYQGEARTKGLYDLMTAIIKSKEGTGEEIDPQKIGSIVTQLEELVGDDFTEKFMNSLK